MGKYDMWDSRVRCNTHHHTPRTEREHNQYQHGGYSPPVSGEAYDDTLKRCWNCDEEAPCTWQRELVEYETGTELLKLMFRDPAYEGPRTEVQDPPGPWMERL